MVMSINRRVAALFFGLVTLSTAMAVAAATGKAAAIIFMPLILLFGSLAISWISRCSSCGAPTLFKFKGGLWLISLSGPCPSCGAEVSPLKLTPKARHHK